MIGKISIVGLMAGLSFAQTSTVTLYIPGADTQPLVGSVIGAVCIPVNPTEVWC